MGFLKGWGGQRKNQSRAMSAVLLPFVQSTGNLRRGNDRRCAELILCGATLLASHDEVLGWTQNLIFEVDRWSDVAVPVQPSATLYEYRVAATMRNGLRDVVYLARCRSEDPVPTYSARSSTGRHVAYDPARSCPTGVPHIAVKPGENCTDTLTIVDQWVMDGSSGFPIEEIGRPVLSRLLHRQLSEFQPATRLPTDDGGCLREFQILVEW